VHKGFSKEWYSEAPYLEMWYRGWPIVKCPLDLHQYHEIVQQTRPDLIVETGSFSGASALFLADQIDLLDDPPNVPNPIVVSIDIDPAPDLPDDDRIEFIVGQSSTDLRVLERVKEIARGRRVMVVLDSDHSKEHVLKELDRYAPLVSAGCYLIVEDTNRDAYESMIVSGYIDGKLAGPAEAVKAWQPKNKGFEADRRRERFLFTQNPGGYLKRVR
jgi:cephalosporin hydroxylase